MYPQTINHEEIALSRLKDQFRDKPVIEGLLKSYVQPMNEVEESLDFLRNISIFSAKGEDLDRIGRLYGVPRQFRDDDSYRQAILGYIASTEPDASPEGIVEALKAFGQTNLVRLHEHYPGYTQVWIGEGYNGDMYPILKTLCPAGTDIGLYIDDRGDSMMFDEEEFVDSILVGDDGRGFALEYAPLDFRALTVSTTEGDLEEGGLDSLSVLAEEGDLTWVPMAELIDRVVYTDSGLIVDEFDDHIVDEFDDNLIYIDIRSIGD